MALMQITIIPLGTGSPGVGEYVADIESFLQESGAEYSLHDMGTIIRGSADELLRLALQIHQLPFARGVQRVVTHISIDERVDKDPRIGDKAHSVGKHLRGKKS